MEKPKVDLVPEQERPTIVGTKTITPDETLVWKDEEESYFPDDESY